MKRLLAVLTLLAASTLAWGQSGNTVTLQFAGVPTGSCAPVMLGINTSNGDLYNCFNGSWHASGTSSGTGTVTSFSAGTLAPLFTTSVATASTTPALSFILTNAAGRTIFANNTAGSAAPAYVAPSLTSTLFDNQGTTTTLLIGNAAGHLSFGQVDLTSMVTGNLPVGNLNSGTGASATTVWSGNATWQSIASLGGATVSGTPSAGQIGFWASATAIQGLAAAGDISNSTNTFTVNKVNGVAYPSAPSTHSVPVITASNTTTYKVINDCTGGTNALSYAQSTDAFGCVANVVNGTFTSTRIPFASGASTLTTSANLTYSAASGITMTQGADTSDALVMLRATDTTPTGNFLRFKNNAATNDLVLVDVSGNVSASSYSAINVSGTAGMVSLVQGTLPAAVSNAVNLVAPTSVTTYTVTFPTAAAAGFWNMTGGGTLSFGTLSGDATSSGLAVTNTKVNGVAYPASPSTDSLPIVTAANTVTYGLINGGATCGDSSHAISYSATTHLFGCQSITGSAAAGGSNTQVQFNSGGALAGSANLTWVSPLLLIGADGATTGQLGIAGATSGHTTLTSAIAAGGTWTLRNATDNVVGAATTDTLTNKTYNTAGTGNTFQINGTGITAVTGSGSVVLATSATNVTLDAEGSGNVLTRPIYASFSPTCNNATAGPGDFNVPTSAATTFSCSGTTSTLGNADFVDGSTTGINTQGFLLPQGWTGNVDVRLSWWANASSSNAVRWSVAMGCVASGATVNTGPSYNTASATNAAYTGTANQLQVTTISAITTTGCTAGTSQAFFQIQRIGGNAGDTLTATAELTEMQIELRATK